MIPLFIFLLAPWLLMSRSEMRTTAMDQIETAERIMLDVRRTPLSTVENFTILGQMLDELEIAEQYLEAAETKRLPDEYAERIRSARLMLIATKDAVFAKLDEMAERSEIRRQV